MTVVFDDYICDIKVPDYDFLAIKVDKNKRTTRI